MQIVIDIDEEDYKRIQDTSDVFNSLTSRTYSAIRNGTPLPKGHGRLIDAGEYENGIRKHYFDNSTVIRCTEIALDNAPTIIDADIPTMYYPQVEGITPTIINNGSDMLSAEEIDNLLQALAKGESEE